MRTAKATLTTLILPALFLAYAAWNFSLYHAGNGELGVGLFLLGLPWTLLGPPHDATLYIGIATNAALLWLLPKAWIVRRMGSAESN